jgi:hypothetical protein
MRKVGSSETVRRQRGAGYADLETEHTYRERIAPRCELAMTHSPEKKGVVIAHEDRWRYDYAAGLMIRRRS